MVKGPVAHHVDQSRNSTRRAEDEFDRGVGKLKRSSVAGHGEAMRDVGSHVLPRKRRQLASDRNALIELAHLRRTEMCLELRLADKQNLKQPLPIFHIGKDADFLEKLRWQILRFV